MKKIIAILCVSLLIFASCSDTKIGGALVVDQINILESNDYKYEVRLRTDKNSSGQAYYYTDFRYQVGDTFNTYDCFFKNFNSVSYKFNHENDSLRKELNITKYYLEILKERINIDSVKTKK